MLLRLILVTVFNLANIVAFEITNLNFREVEPFTQLTQFILEPKSV